MQFDHERLDVFSVAIDFVAIAHRMAAAFPTGHGDLSNQLRRAANSIPLNIGEGAGEYSRQAKANFYRIALRSSTECAAILAVAQRLELVETLVHDTGRELLLRVVSMLTKMVRSLSSPRSGNGNGSGNRA
jgi:four helix bundle protein